MTKTISSLKQVLSISPSEKFTSIINMPANRPNGIALVNSLVVHGYSLCKGGITQLFHGSDVLDLSHVSLKYNSLKFGKIGKTEKNRRI